MRQEAESNRFDAADWAAADNAREALEAAAQRQTEALERATAAQVQEAIPDAPSYTAVRTLLTILEREGHVRHAQEGRHYVYMPAQARQSAARSAVRQLVQTFFGGSLERAVTTMISEAEADLTDEELARLSTVIERVRAGEGEG